jgi:hypothetical protein
LLNDLLNCRDDITQKIFGFAQRQARGLVSPERFAGCRSAKRARTCVDRERLILEKEGRGG